MTNPMEDALDERYFKLHECEHSGCDKIVAYWDEPYCFHHSPDSGSSFRNYDARKGGWLS